MLSKLTKLIGFSVVSLVLVSGLANAQPATYPDIALNVNFPPPVVDRIKLSDLAKFDPAASGGSSRILFSIEIRNTNTSAPVSIKANAVELAFKFNGKGITSFTNGRDVILRAGETGPVRCAVATGWPGMRRLRCCGRCVNFLECQVPSLPGCSLRTAFCPGKPVERRPEAHCPNPGSTE